MGIDNTELLPPFLPVQRAEEFVWSWLINKCVPGALFGVAPRAILHRPAEGRAFEPDAAVLNAGKFTTGETIAFLISAEKVHGASRAELIRAMGSHLEELDCLEEGDFREHVRMASHAAVLSWLQRLDAAMHDTTNAESFWVKDVQRMKDECVRCLAERDYAVPFDLEQAWGVVEGRRRFRDVLSKFAQLLRIWPDLVDQAKALQANGITLCSSQ